MIIGGGSSTFSEQSPKLGLLGSSRKRVVYIEYKEGET
jgi:hypothetical protein